MCRPEVSAQEVSVRPAPASEAAAASAKERNLKAMCKKTKLCKFFQKGMCNRMANCHFAHSEEELTNAPDLSRTKLCRSLLIQETCTDAQCTFAHSKVELRHLAMKRRCQIQQSAPDWLQHANDIEVDKHTEAYHGFIADHNNGEESRETVDKHNGNEKRLLLDEVTNPFDRQMSAPAEPTLRVKNTFLTWGLPAELCCPRRSQSAPPRLATDPSMQAGCNDSDSMCNLHLLKAVSTVHPMDMLRAKPESPSQCLVVSPWGAFRRSSPPPRARRPSVGVPKLM